MHEYNVTPHQWLHRWTWDLTFLILDKRHHRVMMEHGESEETKVLPDGKLRGDHPKVKALFPDAKPNEVYSLEPEDGWSFKQILQIMGGG